MTYYEVWGYDTFADEDYSCGKYSNLLEAQKVLEKHEAKVALTQDESLRDTFFISKTTDEDIKLQEEEEEERNQLQSYKRDHLTQCVKALLKQFKKDLSTTKPEDWLRLWGEEKYLTQEIQWDNEDDCFTKVYFNSYCIDSITISVGTGICVRSGRLLRDGQMTLFSKIRGTSSELMAWAETKKAVQQCVKELDELIASIYKDQQ